MNPSTAISRLLQELDDDLASLKSRSLRRQLNCVDALEDATAESSGQRLVNWCSNDYLGLASHPVLIQAACAAAEQWGIGARAARLLSGTSARHDALERLLADFFGQEAAIVFSSGYLTNLGVLGSLLSAKDTVFVDKLAHASLIDAARSTRANFKVFHHNNADQLKRLLSRSSSARRRIVVTEGIFSMDGDRCALEAILQVAERADALVYLDDAHGVFISGATGRGTPEALSIALNRLLYVGTLSKALGCQGGFLVGPQVLIQTVLNRARPFLFSTAPAIPVMAAAERALKIVDEEAWRRQRLWDRSRALHQQLQQGGLSRFLPAEMNHLSNPLNRMPPSPIIPIILKDSDKALQVARKLWERGHWAPAIRPPTVPQGSARLRLSLSALHSPEQLKSLVAALQESVA